MAKLKQAAAALCLGVFALFALHAVARADVFPVGIVTPLSGGGADYGIAFQNGVKMAAEEINKAGGISVAGRTYTIEPVFCDDEFKPDKAVNCGKELAAQRKVRVIMTPSSLAAFPMMGFNQQQGFMLMATSQTPKFTTLGNKLVVRFTNNTDRTMEPWVNLVNAYFQKEGKAVKKVAIMVVNTELGKSWADNFARYWAKLPGASVVGKASYDANDTDFYPQLSTLLPNEPDALVLTTVCQPSAIVIKQARELGFKGPIINSAACSGEELAKLLPAEQTNGTILELSGWGADDPAITAFKKAYQDKFNLTPQQISGLGYDGLRWLARAVSDAGSVDDATKIRAAMPAALAATKTMFSMSNLDQAGDIDMPVLVGIMSNGKVTAFSGAK
ncbi:ABC transporter substrate-binding protein [Rhodopila sp.]|uniref:ABC transporter substrate-binding protein n=1 Tax=Rhodopila sp. TaxID=2480087 RepID=UPI002B5FDCB4|nr:ABC transporter substrate-binding protein [Rhodopila sp.]HVZ10380.1 ABC transporter substrate-binding protein [Rhodopila sp.]